jgi:hypothetical protein
MLYEIDKRDGQPLHMIFDDNNYWIHGQDITERIGELYGAKRNWKGLLYRPSVLFSEEDIEKVVYYEFDDGNEGTHTSCWIVRGMERDYINSVHITLAANMNRYNKSGFEVSLADKFYLGLRGKK